MSACGGGSSGEVEPVSIGAKSTVNTVQEESFYSVTPTLFSGTGDITYTVQNKPTWLEFDGKTGTLSGTPDDADVGLHLNIVITASNSVSSSSMGPFYINVIPVNDVPVINEQTIIINDFNQSNSFTLNYADIDNSIDELTLNVHSQPEHGQVTQSEINPAQLIYTPTSINGAVGDSFEVTVSDRVSSSEKATIQLVFQDQSAPSLFTNPVDGAINVSLSDRISISSDDALKASSLTFNTSDAVCSGSVQVSSDNFSSCIGINRIEMHDLNKRAEIILSSPLSKDTEYQIKVLDQVQNIFGVNALSTLVSHINTSKGLLLTEVSECYYNNTFCWFELYNPTSDVIDLSEYSFKSVYINGSGNYKTDGNVEFSLPSVDIQPGQYVVVRSDKNGDSFASNQRVVFAHEAGSYPYWGDEGYIDLLFKGVTQDFVTFGSEFNPVTALEWRGFTATAPSSQANSYGASIGRDGNNTDTNSASDWTVYDYASMAGVNDVTCNDDADQDGIPDCSEQPGSTYAGLPLYEWGARAGQKDIFIELDYMDATNNNAQSQDEGITPRKEALQKVVEVFAAQGIVVHFDVGDLYDQAAGLDPDNFDLGGGEEIPFVDALTFSTTPSVYDLKLENFDYSRFQVFHYLIFANTQNGTQGSSGLAEMNGNDLIVTLGEWGLNSSNTNNTNRLINFQASTLMHELGHNLGLSHGGDQDVNNKPNYFSIMNYLYQLSGLSEIGNNEGDRYYAEFFSGNANCGGSFTNPSTSSSFRMDFSHGVSAPITKNAANETTGLGQMTTSGVDFNCDGDRIDTSANTGRGSGTWSDFDDWGNINLDFRNYFSGNQNGLSLVTSSRDLDPLMLDKVGNDRAPVAIEYSPSPAFFEELNAQMNQ
ncbi:MAG: Ig-like domain-containing protein [Bermanella sp.]